MALAAFTAGAMVVPIRSAPAAVTERIALDRFTGVAIGGYDPVAYFAAGKAVAGVAEFEHRHAGAVWRFRNAGNLAAFERDPDVYAPRFGGFDPLAVGRGVTVAGHPEIYAVIGRRLFLFRDEAARRAFLEDPEAALALAGQQWEALRLRLIGN